MIPGGFDTLPFVIELSAVSKIYDDKPAVDGISFQVERGDLLALLGGSGSGKTTTLKMINRLIEPTSGVVKVGGKDTSTVAAHELRRSIGYVLQDIGLFPHMTVAENVGITTKLLGWSPARTAERVKELLELVELDPGRIGPRAPSELSGGQRQRVGIARALAARPEVMLLDEPFGALDPITRRTLQKLVLRLWKEQGLTAVIVTHDVHEAMLLGTYVAVMCQGKLLQIGRPEAVVRNPADDYVRDLLEAQAPPAAMLPVAEAPA